MVLTVISITISYTAIMKQRTLFRIMTAGAALGAVSAFLQTLEKITLLKNKDALLACDLNSVLSCTNVLNAWQSSVFSFPNSIICLMLFTIFATTAAAGASGAKLPRGFRLGIQGLSLATLLFALWFITQSIYVINALCLFCIFCFIGLLLVNGAWLRLNAQDLPIGTQGRALLARGIASGADVFAWFLLGAALAFAMVLRFA